MFRLNKMPAKKDAGPVHLTSFSLNGDSAETSENLPHSGVPKAVFMSNHGSSKSEILGPTGTVRGFKNIIKERKEFLRLTCFSENCEVGE